MKNLTPEQIQLAAAISRLRIKHHGVKLSQLLGFTAEAANIYKALDPGTHSPTSAFPPKRRCASMPTARITLSFPVETVAGDEHEAWLEFHNIAAQLIVTDEDDCNIKHDCFVDDIRQEEEEQRDETV